MDVVVLSPHRDDAAFSCGLLIHALLEAHNSVRIVNVCTRSSYAPWLVYENDIAITRVTEIRRAEDESFAARVASEGKGLTPVVEITDLNWLDAPERWNMPAESVLEPHVLRSSEIDLLKQALAAIRPADFVLAPMALGEHLDHRLVREAARAAFSASQLVFYEDLPYACRLEKAVEPPDRLHCLLLPPGSSPGRKRDDALCYPSQIDGGVAEEMEQYARALGYRERYCGDEKTLQNLAANL